MLFPITSIIGKRYKYNSISSVNDRFGNSDNDNDNDKNSNNSNKEIMVSGLYIISPKMVISIPIISYNSQLPIKIMLNLFGN